MLHCKLLDGVLALGDLTVLFLNRSLPMTFRASPGKVALSQGPSSVLVRGRSSGGRGKAIIGRRPKASSEERAYIRDFPPISGSVSLNPSG